MDQKKLRRIANLETQQTEALLHYYSMHKSSNNMPWHGKSSLRGTCAIASLWLANKLKTYNLKAFVIFGYLNPRETITTLPKDTNHCWVICHNGDPSKALLCDPTARQFFPGNPITKTPPKKALVTTISKSCELGYIPKSRPKNFTNWPNYCHPLATNANGINHQLQLEILEKSLSTAPA